MSASNPEDLISVSISSDKMTATLLIRGSDDACVVTKQLCMMTLAEENVMVTAEVERAVDAGVAAYQENPAADMERIIATGMPAVHGVNERLEFVPEFNPLTLEEERHSKEEGGGSDFYSVVTYRLATTGDVVANVCPATAGQDGMTVTGDTLVARTAQALTLTTDETVSIRDDGAITAMIDGVVQYSKGRLSVLPQLLVDENVDFSTGNVNFEGDVVVKKSVKDRFEVSAAQSITVQGLVEAATLRAGTDIILSGGMAAREKGVIEAERDVKARYLDSVSGFVGRNLEVEKEVVNCRIVVGGEFHAERGAIIGGHMRISGACSVSALGSDGGGKTKLTLGSIGGFHEMRVQIDELSPAIEATLARIKGEYDLLKHNETKLTEGQTERLAELQFEVSSMESLAAKLKAGHSKLQETEEQFAETNLTVQGRIHPGVTLNLGEYIAEFESGVKGPVRITMGSSGRPVITDLVSNMETDLRERARVVEREEHGKTGSMAA